MNTANLQLEGLCIAVAALCDALKRKGVLSADEIDSALAAAESSAGRSRTELSPANQEAISLMPRILRLANKAAPYDDMPSFAQLAREAGERKSGHSAVEGEDGRRREPLGTVAGAAPTDNRRLDSDKLYTIASMQEGERDA